MPAIDDYSAITDRREPYAHCVCVVGKNYRLQNIQLSKIRLRPAGFGATSPVGPVDFFARPAATWPAEPWRRLTCMPAQKLVENTGLEPVTSWLQTRRSPS
jgi:hypothetical protein